MDRRNFVRIVAGGLTAVPLVARTEALETTRHLGVPGRARTTATGGLHPTSSTISSVDPCFARNCVYSAINGQAGVLAYSGMAVAPECGALGSLVVTGGGHADYYGNEVYVFDLATERWTRINNPSTALTGLGDTDPTCDWEHGEYGDGSPMASHTYNNLQVIPNGVKGLLVNSLSSALYGSGGRSNGWSHACDLATGNWFRYSSNAAPPPLKGCITCFDALRSRVWRLPAGGYHSTFSYLDLATRTHVQVPFASSNVGYDPVAAAIPVHDMLLFTTGIGLYDTPMAFTMCAVDLVRPERGVKTLNVDGDIPPPTTTTGWGFDWSPDLNAGFMFMGNADLAHVYRLDPPTGDLLTGMWKITRIALPQPLSRGMDSGLYSRWRYVSNIKLFAYVATTKDRVALWNPAIK